MSSNNNNDGGREATNQQLKDNREFYDRISRRYDFVANANERQAREAGEQALELQAGEKVLEIGFGTGNSLVHMAESVGRTGRVFGIDVSQGMLSQAQKKIETKHPDLTERIELQIGDARSLPVADCSFDAVFMSFTLELFSVQDIAIVLAEVRRVLKPAGRIGVVSMATTPVGKRVSFMTRVYIWFHEHFPRMVDCQPIDAPKHVQQAGGLEICKQIDMEIWTMPVKVLIAKKTS